MQPNLDLEQHETEILFPVQARLGGNFQGLANYPSKHWRIQKHGNNEDISRLFWFFLSRTSAISAFLSQACACPAVVWFTPRHC